MFEYELDMEGFLNEMMPNIHHNNNIPQEVKDAWIELCVIENVNLLSEEVVLAE